MVLFSACEQPVDKREYICLAPTCADFYKSARSGEVPRGKRCRDGARTWEMRMLEVIAIMKLTRAARSWSGMGMGLGRVGVAGFMEVGGLGFGVGNNHANGIA